MRSRFLSVSTLCYLFTILLTSCGARDQGSLPTPILYGDWISSGGENFKDANNPWWVKNTASINYCIQVDEHTISTSSEIISDVVSYAFKYWKEEFARKTSLFKDSFQLLEQWNDIGVGTQSINKIACNGNEDVRLQFGYGTLTDDQKKYLRDPPHYVGVAVRTHYDTVNLRGKGFVFIGSDKGANRFAPSTQAEGSWSKDIILYLAVLHELGHVFGIPHVGSRYSLMGAQILELFTSQMMAPYLESVAVDFRAEYPFFIPGSDWKNMCMTSDKWTRFFKIREKRDCLWFHFDEAAEEISISAHSKGQSDLLSLGKLTSLELDFYSDFTSGVMMMLGPSQQVFPSPDKTSSPWRTKAGPYFVSGKGGARMVLIDGTETLVHMAVAPDRFEISGELDGKHQIIVNW
ncbi:MAG: hypothetical protein HY537_08770 [Deltaproteobacteria bacterium]|nr:hypothetical protein [Deltaproteobacteria bacterium]